jgi:hypothetical protein
MSSPKRRRASPIESVELKVTFRVDRETARRIKEIVPSAVLRSGVCEVVIEAEAPAEVADRAKEILEKVRAVVGSPERL